MSRKLVLTASLYCTRALSLLDFITQCSEIFKDDVFSWKEGDSLKTPERFRLYTKKHECFNYRLFRLIRNLYVHEFDSNARDLYITVLQVTLLDLRDACKYFGIAFNSAVLLEEMSLAYELLEHLRDLEEIYGSKES